MRIFIHFFNCIKLFKCFLTNCLEDIGQKIMTVWIFVKYSNHNFYHIDIGTKSIFLVIVADLINQFLKKGLIETVQYSH